MTDKPRTRAQLEARIAELEAENADGLKTRDHLRVELNQARDREKQTHEQFGDLKIRLAVAEAAVARMEGYIARVQEDDVVREELVATGDPAGQQQLVPKRKPTVFGTALLLAPSRGWSDQDQAYVGRETRKSLFHWVNY